MLPEPRSLVDRALPVSHWETGVIVLVNQIDIIKDTWNCPRKVMKISHFEQTNQRLLSIL